MSERAPPHAGATSAFTLDEDDRAGNLWLENDIEPGRYTVTATAAADGMTGQAVADVVAGVDPNR